MHRSTIAAKDYSDARGLQGLAGRHFDMTFDCKVFCIILAASKEDILGIWSSV